MPPADWTVNIVIWATIAAAIAGWQIIAVRSPDLPAFGDLIRLARRSWLLRWSIVAFWVWLGWHLFVRTTFEP
jgi:hypothetical protein